MVSKLLTASYAVMQRITPCDVAYVYQLDTAVVEPAPLPADVPDFRFLTAEELARFNEEPANDLNGPTVEQVRSGEARCWGAIEDGRLASYACFAAGDIAPEHNRGSGQLNGIGLRLTQNARYLFKAFVVPSFRGRSLMRNLITSVAREYHKQGIESLVTTTSITNDAFHFSALKGGFVVVGRTFEVRLMGRHRYHFPSQPHATVKLYAGSEQPP